jgi:hypothetical protein
MEPPPLPRRILVQRRKRSSVTMRLVEARVRQRKTLARVLEQRQRHAEHAEEDAGAGEMGSWAWLPAELLVEMWRWLPLDALLCCREVCRRWARLCSEAPVRALLLPARCNDLQLHMLRTLFPRAARLMVHRRGLALSRKGLRSLAGQESAVDFSLVRDPTVLTAIEPVAYGMGLLELSCSMLAQLVVIRPRDAQHRGTLAAVLHHLGRSEEAVEVSCRCPRPAARLRLTYFL